MFLLFQRKCQSEKEHLLCWEAAGVCIKQELLWGRRAGQEAASEGKGSGRDPSGGSREGWPGIRAVKACGLPAHCEQFAAPEMQEPCVNCCRGFSDCLLEEKTYHSMGHSPVPFSGALLLTLWAVSGFTSVPRI